MNIGGVEYTELVDGDHTIIAHPKWDELSRDKQDWYNRSRTTRYNVGDNILEITFFDPNET